MRTGLLAAIAILTNPALAQPAIGDRSPELGIEQLLNAPADAEATLESLRGKFVVLEFWATWCGPCIGAIPHLNRMHEAYADRVVFISVTNEDRSTVQTFQEGKSKIANWIGLDTDRSLHEAYAVRAIPKTVVLDQNGRVVAITNPFSLTPEQMDAYLSGERQQVRPANLAAAASPEDRIRASFSGPAVAGRDPLDGLDESPHMQFILRPASIKDGSIQQIAFTSGDRITALRVGRDDVLEYFYPLPSSLIDRTALEPSEAEYDFILGGDFPIDDARRLALRAFNAEEHREMRTITAYRLELTGDAPRNPTDIDAAPESHFSFKDGDLHFTDSHLTPDWLAQAATGWLGTPCENDIDPDIRLNARLVIPPKLGPEGLAALLEEAHGITLVPFETEREVVVIRPKREAAN